jgi:hypothetical protein
MPYVIGQGKTPEISKSKQDNSVPALCVHQHVALRSPDQGQSFWRAEVIDGFVSEKKAVTVHATKVNGGAGL